jgi:DNA polymerase-3 subunit gamma/tau
MSYQVIARKWRPQKFDDVVGQQAVTRTLRNALKSNRLAQAFVFAGPRGIGKTTTARILARALNCVNGPTADPCGVCDACVEIAEGRDMDVLEIDAATHTQVENIREVIVTGLAIAPVRNRFKVFIIDEVHQLSSHSFNALLKSIEEPPPHVVFMMATTELDKIPDTVLSRSQVYELRTIGTKTIAEQLRRIVDAEQIEVSDDALQLIARDAEGSMRDAQSKLDQVLAFTGQTITAEDVATVLGLVGRDLLLDAVQAVADEDAAAAFALTARAVDLGYDLRAVCRELSRVVRDLLVLSVDPSRISDPEIAGESERERLKALAGRFSREDLLRAFDVLTKAETDIRAAAQPRYHLEMAFLRWIYLRKLMPIEDLIAGAGGPERPAPRATSASFAAPPTPAAGPAPARPAPASTPRVSASTSSAPSPAAPAAGAAPARSDTNLKDALLAEVRKSKAVFYNTVIAQAQKIEVAGDRVTFTFSPNHRTLRDVFEQQRAWLESAAQQVSGRKIAVTSVQNDAPPPGGAAASAGPAAPPANHPGNNDGQIASDQKSAEKKSALREQAMADAGVQTMLEIFPAEIRDVEEM